MFYSTLYTSKSTQEEDSEKQLQIGRAVIKRIKRVLDDNKQNSTTSNCNNEDTQKMLYQYHELRLALEKD